MDFLRNILAVHLIQDIFERGNVSVIPKGVDTVIHGDIADTVSWEDVYKRQNHRRSGIYASSSVNSYHPAPKNS